MVYTKSYIFNRFYLQYLVLLTMVPRNSATVTADDVIVIPPLVSPGHVGDTRGLLAAGGQAFRGQRVHDAGQEDHGCRGPQDAR